MKKNCVTLKLSQDDFSVSISAIDLLAYFRTEFRVFHGFSGPGVAKWHCGQCNFQVRGCGHESRESLSRRQDSWCKWIMLRGKSSSREDLYQDVWSGTLLCYDYSAFTFCLSFWNFVSLGQCSEYVVAFLGQELQDDVVVSETIKYEVVVTNPGNAPADVEVLDVNGLQANKSELAAGEIYTKLFNQVLRCVMTMLLTHFGCLFGILAETFNEKTEYHSTNSLFKSFFLSHLWVRAPDVVRRFSRE